MTSEWMQGVRTAVGALVIFGAGSCARQAALPAVPSFEAGHEAVWRVAPADAGFGIATGDLAHTLGRLRALRTVVATGATGRGLIEKFIAPGLTKLDGDLLEPATWTTHGIDAAGPFGAFAKDRESMFVFRATDATKARQMYERVSDEKLECEPVGALLRCATGGWKVDPAQSLGTLLEKEVSAEIRAMEIVAFSPMTDVRDSLHNVHSAYGGLTLTPERALLRVGGRVDEAAALRPYLQAREGTPSILGLATGGVSAGRITYSPEKLWGKAKETLAATAGLDFINAAQVLGIDIEKDIVENATGEIVFAGYRSDRKLGKDGKARSLTQRVGTAMIFGTRDDKLTRKLANRAGELLGGVVGTLGDGASAMGFRISYRKEDGDRPTHWFKLDLDEARRAMMGVAELELFVTSVPGGVACGLGPVGIEELRRQVGKKPAAFLEALPLPSERAMFEKSPFVLWTRIGDGLAAQGAKAEPTPYDALSPELGKMVREALELAQLVFDASASIEIVGDRAELRYELTFL